MDTVKPFALEKGDTIGIFAPAMPAHILFKAKYEHGISELKRIGFNIIEGSVIKSGKFEGYRTAQPKERASEFMELINNDQVKCLMAVIGGYNSSSLLPYLDYKTIREKRKIICGYSDITVLHMAILIHSGLSVFYGPALVPSFGEWPSVLDYTLDSFLQAVTNKNEKQVLRPPVVWSNHFRDAATDAWKTVPREFMANSGWIVLNPGKVTGQLVIANLNTLVSLAGTPYFPDLTGKILLLEEMNAPFTVEERSFTQLLYNRVFDKIKGLIIGKPENLDTMNAPFSYDELILRIIGNRPYPVISNFDCGHTHPMITLSEDILITLEAGVGGDVSVIIEEGMVE